MKVGLIGVGLMGHGIAKNIVTKGWELSFLDQVGNQSTTDLLELGAKPYDKAVDLAAASDVLVLCVTGSPQVEDVLTGSGAVLDGLRPGSIVIDCSTAIPSSTRALAAKVGDKGSDFVDAAMTRTPKEAEEGRLNLLVGGKEESITRIRSLLESFAENIFIAGDVGSGHQLKLIHNIISMGTIALIAEVAACAIQDGMDTTAARLMSKAAYDTLAGQIDQGKGSAFMPELVKLLQSPSQ
mgnify:CR=1 FL=1